MIKKLRALLHSLYAEFNASSGKRDGETNPYVSLQAHVPKREGDIVEATIVPKSKPACALVDLHSWTGLRSLRMQEGTNESDYVSLITVCVNESQVSKGAFSDLLSNLEESIDDKKIGFDYYIPYPAQPTLTTVGRKQLMYSMSDGISDFPSYTKKSKEKLRIIPGDDVVRTTILIESPYLIFVSQESGEPFVCNNAETHERMCYLTNETIAPILVSLEEWAQKNNIQLDIHDCRQTIIERPKRDKSQDHNPPHSPA